MNKKIIAIILVFSTFIFSSIPISAATSQNIASEPYASYLIVDYLGYVKDQGSGTLRIVCDITAKYSIEQLGASHIEIQRYDPSTNSWNYVGTIYGNSYNNLLRNNSGSVLQGVNFDGLSIGKTYRAVIRFYAQNGSIEETRYYVTGGVTLS